MTDAVVRNTTNNASASPLGTTYRERYKLLSTAQTLLHADDHRTCTCSKYSAIVGDNITITRNTDTQTASYGNLKKCGSVWACPVCATRISEQRRVELETAITNYKASGKLLLHLTLTLSHQRAETCQQVLDRFKKAYRHFTSGRRWQLVKDDFKIVGTIRALETTFGDNGWHIHAHVLLFIDLPANWSYGNLEGTIAENWLKSVAAAGGKANSKYGAKITTNTNSIAEYLAKHGRLPKNAEQRAEKDMGNRWNESHELAKQVSKKSKTETGLTPFMLLAEASNGNHRAGKRFVEYVKAFHGARQLVWSNGLKERLLPDQPDQSDEEIAEQTDPEIVAYIDQPMMTAISRRQLRGYVLDLALNDPQALARLLAAIAIAAQDGWKTVYKKRFAYWRIVVQQSSDGYFRSGVYRDGINSTVPDYASVEICQSEMEAYFAAQKFINSYRV